jgi:hypothetical protein
MSAKIPEIPGMGVLGGCAPWAYPSAALRAVGDDY